MPIDEGEHLILSFFLFRLCQHYHATKRSPEGEEEEKEEIKSRPRGVREERKANLRSDDQVAPVASLIKE